MAFGRLLQIALIVSGCHAGVPLAAPPAATPAVNPVISHGLVDIGGITLHLHCVGQGAPVVVMDSGLGNDGTVWKEVQRGLHRSVRACAYDRAGLGYSSPAPRPHTNRQMARELYQLLHRAGLEPPYVLVGHSMGGVNVRLFEAEHPDEVAGMVLVDATVDPIRSRAIVPELEQQKLEQMLPRLGEGLDFATFAAGAADMRAASRSLGAKPLVVLTRSVEEPPPWATHEQTAEMLRIWNELQAQLPKLSTNALQIIVPNARHHIQLDAPQVVTAAIAEVVAAVREKRPLSEAALRRRVVPTPHRP
jgi:pimeloyl-ACP methyl ester carboxylesterase